MECPICFENTACTTTNCGHKFCDLCLDKWFYYSSNCPLCRDSLISKDEMEIVIINEDDLELVSVLLPNLYYNHHHISPDELLNVINNKWKEESTTRQFTNDERYIYIYLYNNLGGSMKWYIRDFCPYIKERLFAHSTTFQILCEFEKIITESLYIT